MQTSMHKERGANKGSWGMSFRGKVSIYPRNSKLTCGINESKGQKKRGACQRYVYSEMKRATNKRLHVVKMSKLGVGFPRGKLQPD